MPPTLSLNLRTSCLNLLCAGGIGMQDHTWHFPVLVKTPFHYKYHLTENLGLFVALSIHINPPLDLQLPFETKHQKCPKITFLINEVLLLRQHQNCPTLQAGSNISSIFHNDLSGAVWKSGQRINRLKHMYMFLFLFHGILNPI